MSNSLIFPFYHALIGCLAHGCQLSLSVSVTGWLSGRKPISYMIPYGVGSRLEYRAWLFKKEISLFKVPSAVYVLYLVKQDLLRSIFNYSLEI